MRMRPHYVIAVDAFGCRYEWTEFWSTTRATVLRSLREVFDIEPVYLSVVAV